MNSLLELSLMLSVLGIAGSALAQEAPDPIFDDSACLYVNGDTLFCAYPNLVYDPGIQIIVNGEIANGRHLELGWWPAPLDWYEGQVRARCVLDKDPNRFITVASQWSTAPRVDCPVDTTLVDNPDWFKVRIRELP
jgi:hypothetical protein